MPFTSLQLFVEFHILTINISLGEAPGARQKSRTVVNKIFSRVHSLSASEVFCTQGWNVYSRVVSPELFRSRVLCTKDSPLHWLPLLLMLIRKGTALTLRVLSDTSTGSPKHHTKD